jgi:hypothetical protein
MPCLDKVSICISWEIEQKGGKVGREWASNLQEKERQKGREGIFCKR